MTGARINRRPRHFALNLLPIKSLGPVKRRFGASATRFYAPICRMDDKGGLCCAGDMIVVLRRLWGAFFLDRMALAACAREQPNAI